MILSAEWIAALDYPNARHVMLATFGFGEGGDLWDQGHLGEQQGVIRAASHPNVEVTGRDGAARPWWPTMLAWPTIRRSWSPSERRAELATAEVTLMALAGFPDWSDSMAGKQAGWMRLDLWSDGVALADVIPLLAGPARLVRNDRRLGAYTFRVEDGDLDQSPVIPAGKIDSAEFPAAPPSVIGTAERAFIFSAYPDGVPLHQIDQEGTLFYVHDGRAALPPSRVTLGQTPVEIPFRVVIRTTQSTGTPYTALLFDQSPWSVAASGELSCSGGIGIETASPALTLLEDLGGYRLTSRARLALESLPFAQRVLVGSQADVLSLVRDRLLPQTDAVLGFHAGMVDVLRYTAPAGQVDLALDVHLRGRLPVETTDESGVFNEITITWGSPTTEQGGQSGGIVVVDERHGGIVGELLSMSRGLYGLRPIALNAPDLDSEIDAIHLGEHLAVLLALRHNRHRYSARWLDGLKIDLGTRVMLTDESQELDREPCRVTEIEYPVTGPIVSLQTEDAGRANLAL